MKTFPMFLKMAGRRVVIFGGGEQAAQKTRLMLKTEAEIVVVAAELEPELAGLASGGASDIGRRSRQISLKIPRLSSSPPVIGRRTSRWRRSPAPPGW